MVLFTELPPELIVEILERLSLNDKLNTRSTCKRLRDIIDTNCGQIFKEISYWCQIDCLPANDPSAKYLYQIFEVFVLYQPINEYFNELEKGITIKQNIEFLVRNARRLRHIVFNFSISGEILQALPSTLDGIFIDEMHDVKIGNIVDCIRRQTRLSEFGIRIQASQDDTYHDYDESFHHQYYRCHYSLREVMKAVQERDLTYLDIKIPLFYQFIDDYEKDDVMTRMPPSIIDLTLEFQMSRGFFEWLVHNFPPRLRRLQISSCPLRGAPKKLVRKMFDNLAALRDFRTLTINFRNAELMEPGDRGPFWPTNSTYEEFYGHDNGLQFGDFNYESEVKFFGQKLPKLPVVVLLTNEDDHD